MKKYILFLFLFTFGMFAQERFELKGHPLSFVKPEGWLIVEDRAFKENMDKFEWAGKQEEMERQKAAAKVIAFHKYDPQTYEGIIPTLNVTTGANPTKTFAQFKQMVYNSHAQFKKVLHDFKIVSEPKEIVIDGKKALVESTSYILKDGNGSRAKIKSRMLCLSNGKYYYTITIIEEDGKEDNMAVFDALIKTIKLSDK